MSKRTAAMTALLVFLLAVQAAAEPAARDEAAIRAALTQWASDFNAGRSQEICNLFDETLRYDYRGFPERGYQDICSLLQRSLANRATRYAYALTIKEVLVAGDLAVVRLVWTLRLTREGTAGEAVSQEPGMDIFRKQADGSWKIIRYIAYEDGR
jgi:steroid delta-isomerase